MAISSHEEFRRRLKASITDIDKIVVRLPEPEIRSIQRQLHALEEWTRDGAMPTMEQRRSFSFGLLATRYVDDLDPYLGQQLHLLSSYVTRWEPEPAHSPERREERSIPPTHTPNPMPTPTPPKYDFKLTEERESKADAARREAMRAVLRAWQERMDCFLEEQAAFKEQADKIAPQVEDVLHEWVAVRRDTLKDHFLKVDPFVARSENGANWAVFLYRDEEAFVRYLWRVSLTQDRSERGNPYLLLVDSARRSDEEEAEMWEILGKATGIPARHPYLSRFWHMQEKSLPVAEVLRASPHIPKRPARPAAYYRTNGDMKYDTYFVLATGWIRVSG